MSEPKTYEQHLDERLRTESERLAYLQACLDHGDADVLRLAVRDVLRAVQTAVDPVALSSNTGEHWKAVIKMAHRVQMEETGERGTRAVELIAAIVGDYNRVRRELTALRGENERLRNTVETLESSDAFAGIAEGLKAITEGRTRPLEEIRAGLSRHDPEIEGAVYSAALLCPFCGSDSIDPEYGGDGRAYAYCSSCGARGPTHEDYPSAVFEWNQRAALPGTVGHLVPLLRKGFMTCVSSSPHYYVRIQCTKLEDTQNLFGELARIRGLQLAEAGEGGDG